MTAVAMQLLSRCDPRRHGSAVATGPPSLFIFRALSAMMHAEDEREEDAAMLVGNFKPKSG